MQSDLTKEQAEELMTWEEPLRVLPKKGQVELPLEALSTMEEIECDGPELLNAIAKVNAIGGRVLSMAVIKGTHYVLSVRKSG